MGALFKMFLKMNGWGHNWTSVGPLDRRACPGAFTAKTTIPGKPENFRHCSEKLTKYSLDLCVKWSL